jgi:hypothetical protein
MTPGARLRARLDQTRLEALAVSSFTDLLMI